MFQTRTRPSSPAEAHLENTRRELWVVLGTVRRSDGSPSVFVQVLPSTLQKTCVVNLCLKVFIHREQGGAPWINDKYANDSPANLFYTQARRKCVSKIHSANEVWFQLFFCLEKYKGQKYSLFHLQNILYFLQRHRWRILVKMRCLQTFYKHVL